MSQPQKRRTETHAPRPQSTNRAAKPAHDGVALKAKTAKPKPGAPRAQAKAPAQKMNKGIKLDKGALVPALIVIALIVTLAIHFFGSAKVKQVSVKLTEAARAQAASEMRTDADFIRQAAVMNREMGDIDTWTDEAKDRIAEMPGYVLLAVNKTGSTAVELEITVRTPYAVLSTGGGYVAIDKDKFIVDKRQTNEHSDLMVVDGITLRNPIVGQPAADTSTDDRLENAMYVLNIIHQNDLKPYFTTIHMMEDNEVRLVSIYSTQVRMSLWFKDSFANDLKGTIQVLNERSQKQQTGWIYAVNGNISWHEDADHFTPIKGK